MSKNNENKLVPKLRFSEFVKEGEWNEKAFSQLFEFGNGKDYKHLSSGDIPVYGTGGKMLSVNDFLYDGESVCIGRKGTIDNPLFLTGKFWTVDTLFYTHSFVKCIPKFIYYVFLKIDWYNYNEAGGVPSLSKTTISKIKVPIPPKIDEQKKIAACLSSLDEVITAESQKLEVLKDHKKGLLQNLLPQAGETVPRLRFKEFEDSGEWEIKSVENNIDLISGIALKSEELSDDNSGTPILRGINITEGEVRHSDEMDKFYLGAVEAFEKYLVEENDIVIAMDGSKVGKNVAMISSKDAGAILIQRVARIRAINSDIKYLYQQFLSTNFRNYVDVVNTSSGIPHISAKQIRDFEIGFPPKIEEQQKIATILSSLDDVIIAQNQKLEALQFHKKGLLQGLFPSINNEE